MREGVPGIKRQRGENRVDDLAKIIVCLVQLGWTQLMIIQQMDAHIVELADQFLLEKVQGRPIQLVGDLARRGQHFRRGEAIREHFHDMRLHLLADAGDTHHEKLVHVRAEDGQELQPLEQGIGFIQGLIEDATLEFEQAELSVNEQIGWQGDFFVEHRITV